MGQLPSSVVTTRHAYRQHARIVFTGYRSTQVAGLAPGQPRRRYGNDRV